MAITQSGTVALVGPPAGKALAAADDPAEAREVAAGEGLAAHLARPIGRGHTPTDAFTGAAGGAACGDLIRISVALDSEDGRGRIADAGFDASGCGAVQAAGSAAVGLLSGAGLLEAARIGPDEIAAQLGGLSAAKRHAAELACSALHRAIGAAAAARARLAPSATRGLVAISGGVDSAVAALLLARTGVDLVAVTVELWADPENDGERSCCSAQAVGVARSLAHAMGLPHLSIDLRHEFRAGVVDPWLSEHAAGMTPYPCIRCNGAVRLDAMLALADRLGAGTLATGHYARVTEDPRTGSPLLATGADPTKDQTYALAGVEPGSLARLRFPLGGLTKHEVRELAAEAGLTVASKRDSQDLCFLAGTGSRRFLERHGAVSPREGQIVGVNGEVLGSHPGHQGFTVGQRHGLGISGGPPLFVLATDAATNTVTAGLRQELATEQIAIEDVTLRTDGALVDAVKVRSRGARVGCRVRPALRAGRHHQAALALDREIERTAPGQIACLYAGDLVVGYGKVARQSVRPAAA
jgi:tRNA-specific 2-thiouridylase